MSQVGLVVRKVIEKRKEVLLVPTESLVEAIVEKYFKVSHELSSWANDRYDGCRVIEISGITTLKFKNCFNVEENCFEAFMDVNQQVSDDIKSKLRKMADEIAQMWGVKVTINWISYVRSTNGSVLEKVVERILIPTREDIEEIIKNCFRVNCLDGMTSPWHFEFYHGCNRDTVAELDFRNTWLEAKLEADENINKKVRNKIMKVIQGIVEKFGVYIEVNWIKYKKNV